MKWYREGEHQQLQQPVGPKYNTEGARLQAETRFLKQQIEVI